MKKKKSSGGGANWMDTYGDMVTLLLCFFVLLYSMSTISEENWRALVMSFNPNAILEATQTSGSDGILADPPDPDSSNPGSGFVDAEGLQAKVEEDMAGLYEALQQYIAAAQAENSLSVTQGDGKIYITFDGAVFFNGDSPVLRQDALPILDAICEMFLDARESIDEIRVQGHTAQEWPSQPNDIEVDRSLSSQRAANVVIYFQQKSEESAEVDPERKLDPARLISEGFGQWHPVDTNDTAEGRANNRRVEIIVSGRNLEAEMGDSVQSFSTDPDAAGTETGEAPAESGGEAQITGEKPQVAEEP